MEKILEYVKQVLDLLQQLLDALGIKVDWDALLGSIGLEEDTEVAE